MPFISCRLTQNILLSQLNSKAVIDLLMRWKDRHRQYRYRYACFLWGEFRGLAAVRDTPQLTTLYVSIDWK